MSQKNIIKSKQRRRMAVSFLSNISLYGIPATTFASDVGASEDNEIDDIEELPQQEHEEIQPSIVV
jgi:hypothetical protein